MAVEIVKTARGRKVPIRPLKAKAGKILSLLKQGDGELSIALVGDREIQKLNAAYRAKDEPTDVLSFPAGAALLSGPRLLGDVIISVERAEKQAKERKKSLAQEIESLLIHGILHLLGYDHERSREEATIMRRLEREIARSLVG